MAACCVAKMGFWEGACRVFFPIVNSAACLGTINRRNQTACDSVNEKVKAHWDSFKQSLPDLGRIELREMPPHKDRIAYSKLAKNHSYNNVVYLFTKGVDSDQWTHVAMFFAKHEIGLISNGGHIWGRLVSIIISVAAAIFCVSWYMPLILGFASVLIGWEVDHHMSCKAYNYAFEHATKEELQELIQFLTAKLQLNKDQYQIEDYQEMRARASEQLATKYNERQEIKNNPLESQTAPDSLLMRYLPL